MADYFLSPREETDLRINVDGFASSLLSQWPSATLREVPPVSSHTLEWTLPMPHGRLDGSLDDRAQVIALDGDVRDAATFALWARQQIPSSYALIFYDEGFSAEVPVNDTTGVDDLTRPFLVSA